MKLMMAHLRFTFAPNITYHAPLQDNFSWVPNCSVRPTKCETILSEENCMGYVKIYGFHGNPWGCTYKITHISAATGPRLHNFIPN